MCLNKVLPPWVLWVFTHYNEFVFLEKDVVCIYRIDLTKFLCRTLDEGHGGHTFNGMGVAVLKRTLNIEYNKEKKEGERKRGKKEERVQGEGGTGGKSVYNILKRNTATFPVSKDFFSKMTRRKLKSTQIAL